MTFPLVMITTGGSFGFFMGIGAIFRSGYMEELDISEEKIYRFRKLHYNDQTGKVIILEENENLDFNF